MLSKILASTTGGAPFLSRAAVRQLRHASHAGYSAPVEEIDSYNLGDVKLQVVQLVFHLSPFTCKEELS